MLVIIIIFFGLDRNEADHELVMKAKLKLQGYLRCLPHPLSIKDIMMSWEKCIREAVCDHVKKFGGGSFTSKYGSWEKC